MAYTISVARSIRAAVSFTLLIAVVGCGDDTPPIGKVTGKVTRKGEPLSGITVNFFPDGGRPSWGITDETGNYKLAWDADHDGAEVGKHKVSVAFIPTSMADSAGYGAAGPKKKGGEPKKKAAGIPEEWPEIEKKYGRFDTTQLTREVKPGSQVINLELD